ncbi:MAG: serine hydrolase [Firmicutes bacterium]|nr:serine hydrolase [Bacillota bacterium]
MNKNKITALLCAACVVLTSAASVFAEPTDDAGEADTGVSDGITDTADTDSQISSDVIYMEDDSLTQPDITASQAALLLDIDSGRLLYGKNIDVKLYPASLTKIMTAVIALEQGNLDDTVTVTYDAISSINYLEDSNMGLLTDEQLTLDQLVSAMLIHSANDAANVIACHISGSMDAFVELMNSKAAELGMSNTHFENPSGSHDDNNYTTARDIATLAQYAMQNEKFKEIVKTPIYKIPETNKYTIGERTLVNTNLFLGTSRSMYQYYAPATGIKTGHTSQAGYCLVASASYNDCNLIAVSMKCDQTDSYGDPYTYTDCRTLFEFAFNNYVNQQLAAPGDIISDSKVYEAKNDTRVALTVDTNVSALVPSDIDAAADIVTNIEVPEQISAPVTKGEQIGTVSYTYNGTQIGTANLIATNDVARNGFLHVFNSIMKVITSPFFFIPVILLIILALYMRHRKRKLERKRRIQQLRKAREGRNPRTGQPIPDRRTERIERQRRNAKDSNSRYRK